MQTTLFNTLIINSIILFTIFLISLQEKTLNWKVWFFFYLVLLFSIIEQTIEPICKIPTFYTSLYGILHIVFSLYLFIGSLLFDMYKCHLLILVIVLLGWLIFGGRCIGHLKYNEICNLDERSPFIDMQNVIFNKLLGIPGTIYKWPLVIITIVYDIYHILN